MSYPTEWTKQFPPSKSGQEEGAALQGGITIANLYAVDGFIYLMFTILYIP